MGSTGPQILLRSKHALYPLRCRPNTTDVHVFRQIFGDREYRCLDDVTGVRLVIDCGANVGYSAAYFLSRHPNAKVAAVEPDPANFEILRANLAGYGDRAKVIQAGVWSTNTALRFSAHSLADGFEWSRQVQPVAEGEAACVVATDIGTLLKESGFDRISILKIDIEGSEAAVFSSNYESWLSKVDNLVVELHGERCKSIFADAIAGQGFIVSACDELTVCRRRRSGEAVA